MTPRGANEAFATAFVDELYRLGVRHAVVAPGSRSGPLALALHRSPLKVHVHVDERSAGFLALGLGKAAGIPAVVVCTSGTAPAHLHPAIVEARHDRVPLLVVTADRPPELRATGANQTIDQVKMFGDAVVWFADSGVPDEWEGSPRYWRSLACRAVAETLGTPRGPVHVNVPLREPLYPDDATQPYPHDAGGRDGGRPWTEPVRARRAPDDQAIARLRDALEERDGIIVAGASSSDLGPLVQLADTFGWPLLAEPASNIRVPGTIGAYDALLRSDRFREACKPEVVLRVGKLGLGRPLGALLKRTPQIALDPDGAWLDEHRNVELLVEGDISGVVSRLCTDVRKEGRKTSTDVRKEGRWGVGEGVAQRVFDEVLGAEKGLSEPGAARVVGAALPEDANLFVASSMPVRDLESFMEPRRGPRIFANRGANGIDGCVSATLGIALATGRPTYALLGDLALLHDSNGFLLADREGPDVTFVVVNNDGGGIFSFLEQAGVEGFEDVFGTPHGRDLETLARFHGIGYGRAETRTALIDALRGPRGIRIVEVPSDRARNVEVHRRIWAAVDAALASELEA